MPFRVLSTIMIDKRNWEQTASFSLLTVFGRNFKFKFKKRFKNEENFPPLFEVTQART